MRGPVDKPPWCRQRPFGRALATQPLPSRVLAPQRLPRRPANFIPRGRPHGAGVRTGVETHQPPSLLPRATMAITVVCGPASSLTLAPLPHGLSPRAAGVRGQHRPSGTQGTSLTFRRSHGVSIPQTLQNMPTIWAARVMGAAPSVLVRASRSRRYQVALERPSAAHGFVIPAEM